MYTNNYNVDQLIKTSGLKEPREEFTKTVLQQIQEDTSETSRAEKWANRFSWVLPVTAVFSGILFVFFVVPMPDLSLFSFTESTLIPALMNVLNHLYAIFSTNFYIGMGLGILCLIFLAELLISRARLLHLLY